MGKWYYAQPTVSRPIPAFMYSDGKYYSAFSCEQTIATIEKAIPEMIKSVEERAKNDRSRK